MKVLRPASLQLHPILPAIACPTAFVGCGVTYDSGELNADDVPRLVRGDAGKGGKHEMRDTPAPATTEL